MLEIYAHRGNQADAVENSLTAFAAAVAAGVDGIECDVHLTADQALVIIHDENLARTTDRQGEVSDLTLATIQEARLCFPDGRVTDETVPTLADLLDCLTALNFQGTLNLELKTDQKDYPGIEGRVLTQVATSQPAFDIIYSSFNWHSLVRLRALAPDAPIAALVERQLLPYLDRLPDLAPQAIHLDRALAQPDMLERLAAWPIRLWTVNEPADWARFAQAGGPIQAIMTDIPGQAQAYLAAQEAVAHD